MNITVVYGDLLDQDVDVIVNAWNRNIIPWWLALGIAGQFTMTDQNGKSYTPLAPLGSWMRQWFRWPS